MGVDGRCTLRISDLLWNQIQYLHNQEKIKGLEWSGILLWNKTEGEYADPENLVLTANALHLMDIGTAAYTEYEYEPEDLFDMMNRYPQADPMHVENEDDRWIMGHIHTHHQMDAFFSGTDMEELRDNAPNHKYYLSLIVNYRNKFVAKLCITGKQEKTQIVTNSIFGKKITEIPEQNVIYYIDCDIELPQANFIVGDGFEERYKSLIPKPKAPVHYPASTQGKIGFTYPQPKNTSLRNVYHVYDVRAFLVGFLSLGQNKAGDTLSDIAKSINQIKPENIQNYCNFIVQNFESDAKEYFGLNDIDPENVEKFIVLLNKANAELNFYTGHGSNERINIKILRQLLSDMSEQYKTASSAV